MSQILQHYQTIEGRTFLLFNMEKEPSVRKFEELTRSKVLGILQAEIIHKI